MTETDAATILAEELRRIAPDIDPADIDRGGDLREEFDIDSMDFLTLVTALGKRLDIPMPEADYPLMESFDALAAYLARQSG
ncbi:acyl carrier protein [Ovoidimarina sediminis]|uniref:acyl carrier protein n=1 Tax=Ovoidimarina sediminis TaxID=3079856 RepID=UPI00290BC265|nr:acyl carrier protein [Rhodophyticola sp. MJ-SS7]MDU8943587.1 acyl carrier protein [Rhodophyticola sp. MJ-SS7]